MPLYRYWGNRFSTVVENVLLGTHFTEMHSGMKAYSRRFLESVPFESYSDDFVFDTEILVAAVLGRIPDPGGGDPHPLHQGVVVDQRAPLPGVHRPQCRGLLACRAGSPPAAPPAGGGRPTHLTSQTPFPTAWQVMVRCPMIIGILSSRSFRRWPGAHRS